MNRCIGEYLKSKTVILVTHQIQFIKKADKILVLKEGQSLAFGSYDKLMQMGIDFMSLIKEENKETDKTGDNSETIDVQKDVIVEQFKNRTFSVLSTKSEVFLIFD